MYYRKFVQELENSLIEKTSNFNINQDYKSFIISSIKEKCRVLLNYMEKDLNKRIIDKYKADIIGTLGLRLIELHELFDDMDEGNIKIIVDFISEFFKTNNIEFEKKMIYRPHRGCLDVAMKSARVFNNELEMKEFIVHDWHNQFSIDDIVLYGQIISDKKVGWLDSQYVCVNKLAGEDYIEKYGCPQCIGTCATEY